MLSNTDFEKLWFMYQTDGAPRGISVNTFCQHNGIPYNEFDRWYKKTHRTIERIEITGLPHEDPHEVSALSAEKRESNLHVVIKTPDGLHIEKSGLDYQGLRILVDRLEGLC